MIPWWNIDIGEPELELVVAAMRARKVSQGSLTAELEQRLAARLGTGHAVLTTSGTAALTMAFMALGVGPGTPVVMPNRTWIATANAALILGARILPVDCRSDGGMIIDPDGIRAAIRAAGRQGIVVPVPLNGAATDIDTITDIAARNGWAVVEDACQALFSRLPDGRMMGTSGRFGCFSLGMAKVMTTGAGGFVVCADDSDARLLRRIRNQGMSDYDLSERHSQPGGNFKFTDVQAAIGLAQLDRIDSRIERQKDIYRRYLAGLAGLTSIRLILVDVDAGEVPMRAEILASDRDGLRQALKEQGIDTSAQAPNLADFPFVGADPDAFPRSRPFGRGNLVLPCGPDQPLENVDAAIRAVRAVAARFPSL